MGEHQAMASACQRLLVWLPLLFTGSFFSQLFSSLWGTKETRILILGLDGAGKTTILYRSVMIWRRPYSASMIHHVMGDHYVIHAPSLSLRLQVGEVVTTIPSEWVGLGRLTWTCCSPQQVFVCSQRGGEETHTWGTKLLHEPLLCMTAVLSTFMVGFSSVAAIDKCIMVRHHDHHHGHHQSFLFPFWLQVAAIL